MSKRGQITIFIVVGIVILFAVGIVLYAANIQQKLRVFQEEESEIQMYVGVCLEETAKDAVNSLGVAGGYMDVPYEIKINERAYFSFAQRAEPKIPLWYYAGEPRVPKKEFMEEQIANFTVNNINSCLGDFAVFKDRFEIQLKGNVTADALIGEREVAVTIDYPLELKEKSTGIISRTTPVARSLDVKLGRMLAMAVDILLMENKLTFFENLTIDLLASRDDFPFTRLDFGCTPETWRKSELIDIAKEMIYYNVQQVTVEGNRFQFFDSRDVYARNNFIMPMDNKYPDIGAAFFYSRDSRFELHVRTNDREILRSNVGRPLGSGVFGMIPLCIRTAHFTYDIEYPLLVTLKDEKAFDGEGFMFNFAFPVTINHNIGDKTEFPITIFESEDPNYEFCENVADNVVDVRVMNAFTFEELYKADVEYKCVRYVCDLGATNADAGIYRLRTRLPSACTYGLFAANKAGYLEGTAVYEGQNVVEVFMKPLRKLKVNAVKHDSDDFSKVSSLDKGESFIVMIQSLTDEGFEQMFVSGTDITEIELIDGDATYHIEALMLQDEERMTGGYVGDWSVSYADMADSNEITFHLVQKIPIAVTEEQQQDTAIYVFDDQTYQGVLKPTFS